MIRKYRSNNELLKERKKEGISDGFSIYLMELKLELKLKFAERLKKSLDRVRLKGAQSHRWRESKSGGIRSATGPRVGDLEQELANYLSCLIQFTNLATETNFLKFANPPNELLLYVIGVHLRNLNINDNFR
ncbi:unnamed protein product [Coffea canephora]|uniref:Uncharacterized protein n=1 Tax=Coffea canephora TaxID=49390 RepID=A0A068TU03_COFCA|nr:unnamed protein product [Coffea canephora]